MGGYGNTKLPAEQVTLFGRVTVLFDLVKVEKKPFTIVSMLDPRWFQASRSESTNTACRHQSTFDEQGLPQEQGGIVTCPGQERT